MDASLVYPGLYGVLRTPDQVIEDLLALEGSSWPARLYDLAFFFPPPKEERLSALGLTLPAPPTPAGNYVGSVRVDNLLFVGGNVGRLNAEPLAYTGKVFGEMSAGQAYEMARRCALNHLAAIKAALGDLDRVERVVKVTGYVNAAPGFNEMPKVINGESDLLVELWGEQGRHARAALGVASLSRDAPVEIEVIVRIRD